MSRTPTLPPNDRGMWRQMLARCHPDSGGSHDLFIWSTATRDVVRGGELGSEIPRRGRNGQRWPYSDRTDRIAFNPIANFEVLTDRALAMAPTRPHAGSATLQTAPGLLFFTPQNKQMFSTE